MTGFFKGLRFFIQITEKDISHVRVTFFNKIHISFRKREFEKRKKEAFKIFRYYKKNNIDITTYPKATGVLRDVQLAGLEILKEVDYVCQSEGIDYWLDFGTLLGAIRHKGFIPWDDDIDIGMPREFYKNFIDIFNEKTRNKKIRAKYFRKSSNYDSYFVRIEYSGTILSLDIFPYDFCGEILDEKTREERNNFLKTRRKAYIENIACKKGLTDEEIQEKIKNLRKEILMRGEYKKDSKTDLVWGVDFRHQWKQWFHKYDTIYPLQKVSVEGYEFNCPNNYDTHLKSIYGNYMSYPKDKHTHSAYRISQEELRIIKESIKV